MLVSPFVVVRIEWLIACHRIVVTLSISQTLRITPAFIFPQYFVFQVEFPENVYLDDECQETTKSTLDLILSIMYLSILAPIGISNKLLF